jgi:hypothetical protein
MNRLLIGCAALALLGAGSAAYAQDANQSASGIGSPAATAGKAAPSGQPTMPPANSNTAPAPSDPAANAKTDAATNAAAPATPQSTGTSAPALVDGSAQATTPPPAMAMASTGAVVGDLTTANPPPSAYPACTKKGQDRCTVKSQMRTASMKHRTAAKTGA